MKELIQATLSGLALLVGAWLAVRGVLSGLTLEGAATLVLAMIVLPILTAGGVLIVVRLLWRERQTIPPGPPTPASVIDASPAMPDYYKPPQLPAPTYRLNVPIYYEQGRAKPLGVVLTSRAESANGQAIELGASLETLRKLAPIVGRRAPTRATARDLGIVSNAELGSVLAWLAGHGWLSEGGQGRAREWRAGADPDVFGEWLDQFEGAAARAR